MSEKVPITRSPRLKEGVPPAKQGPVRNPGLALGLSLLVWCLISGSSTAQGASVAIGEVLSLKAPSEGFVLAKGSPRGDFEIEFEVTCNQPGSVLDTVGLNAAPVGSWRIVIAGDYHLNFSLWDGSTWHQLVSQATLSRDKRAVVRLVRQGPTVRFLVDGKQDAALPMATPLSGQPVFVGDFKGDEAWGTKYTIHQGLLGAVKILYLGAPRATPPDSAKPLTATPAAPASAPPGSLAPLVSRADTKRSVAILPLDHEAPVNLFMSDENTRDASPRANLPAEPECSSQAKHFRVCYDKARWPKVGPNDAPKMLQDPARFAHDVGTYLDHAWDKYHNDGYPPPFEEEWAAWDSQRTVPTTIPFPPRIDVTIDPRAVECETGTLSGNITLKFDYESMDQVRHDTAHEVFHTFQLSRFSRLASMAGEGYVARHWWMEATADYAADRIAWGGLDTMAKLNLDYFKAPLNKTDHVHDYSTSRFIDYLVQKGIVFKELWDASLAYDNDNMIVFLEDYLLRRTAITLHDHYKGFAEYALFDASSALELPKGSSLSGVIVPRNHTIAGACVVELDTPPVLDADKSEVSYSFGLKGGYTAKLWGLIAPGKDPKFSRALKIESIGSISAAAEVDANVYVLKSNPRPKGEKSEWIEISRLKGGVTSNPNLYKGTINSNKKSLKISLAKDEIVYIMAVNTGDTFQNFTVKVTDALTIDPQTASVAAGETVSFTTPGVTEKVLWSVQEGATGGTISATGVYTAPDKAGTYHVVATLESDRTVTATATVKTDPRPVVQGLNGSTYTAVKGAADMWGHLRVTLTNVGNFKSEDRPGWRNNGTGFSALTSGQGKVEVRIDVTDKDGVSRFDYKVSASVKANGKQLLLRDETIPVAGGSKTYSCTWNPVTDPGILQISVGTTGGNPEFFTYFVEGDVRIGKITDTSPQQIAALPAPSAATTTPSPAPAVQSVSPPAKTSGAVNLALNKPTQQSSSAYGGDAARAVDGNSDGNYFSNSMSHTAEQAQPWWQMDLGAVQGIKDIKIWNRTDCCAERLSKFSVFVSDSPFASGALNDTISQPGVWRYHNEGVAGHTTAVSVNRGGRYVRIQLEGTNYLHLAEVEVYGSGH